jgi:DNA invertase Pin-like site-specific DNA recombinase
MKRLFGYIRVSTTKQAEKGVSLKEQKSAIQAYADKHAFTIVDWYEEHITAAKRGRPEFNAMLAALRRGGADGIVIHKIDRSARNLGDWADLGELIDAGVDIHLAHEPLDLRSRGGRLSADILAVVAADFVRNNRQEARKGFYGRLKDGIYPLGAPIGYLDQGKGGKVKIVDPDRAPLIRYSFERYASGEVSLLELLSELTEKGLRNRKGGPLTLTGLVTILRNPFYAGVIHLKKTKETFAAIHEPLIRMTLFERVQAVLDGKKPRRMQTHDYLYRRLIHCATCARSLVGTKVKGHVYYRCQVPACPTTCIREDVLEDVVTTAISQISLPDSELESVRAEIESAMKNTREAHESSQAQLQGQLGAINARFERLTDAYIDGKIEKSLHDERRASLLAERQKVTDALANIESDYARGAGFLIRCLQLAKDPENLYRDANLSEKRRLLEIMTSNRLASGKNVEISVAEPFCFLASAQEKSSCALDRGWTSNRDLWSGYSPLSQILLDWLENNRARADRLLVALDPPQLDDDSLPIPCAA